MGFKEATPGLLISLVSIVLLAIVSFNTPLIKSLYFLKATYSDAEVTFGTLGYCSTGVSNGTTTCVGPTVGYEFDFSTIFGVTETVISIPDVVTKLTYVLIVHVAALACAVIALLLAALATIRDFSLLCFPSLFAYLTSALTLLAFVIDVVIFYIARARINALDGASASIGVAVWLTLAAWLVTAIAGCCFTIGSCCAQRNTRGQREAGKYSGVDDREKNAFAMGQGKTLGPAMLEREVSVPLIGADGRPVEDKYLEPETVNGVGYGHGPRSPRATSQAGGGLYPFLATDPSAGDPYAAYGPSHPVDRSGTPTTMAGSFVGVGAGRSMQTVPWAGAGGGAVPGAPGYVPGGSQQGAVGGYDSQEQQQQQQHGGYDAYGQQTSSYGHGQQSSTSHYQDPYSSQGHGGYDDSQMYGQVQPLMPIPRHADPGSDMQHIVSPVESSNNYGGGGGGGNYGHEPQERLADPSANAYGGYTMSTHAQPYPVGDVSGDIGGARPPSYDSAQVGPGVYAPNQHYR